MYTPLSCRKRTDRQRSIPQQAKPADVTPLIDSSNNFERLKITIAHEKH